jgi:hypothetical protein
VAGTVLFKATDVLDDRLGLGDAVGGLLSLGLAEGYEDDGHRRLEKRIRVGRQGGERLPLARRRVEKDEHERLHRDPAEQVSGGELQVAAESCRTGDGKLRERPQASADSLWLSGLGALITGS